MMMGMDMMIITVIPEEVEGEEEEGDEVVVQDMMMDIMINTMEGMIMADSTMGHRRDGESDEGDSTIMNSNKRRDNRTVDWMNSIITPTKRGGNDGRGENGIIIIITIIIGTAMEGINEI